MSPPSCVSRHAQVNMSAHIEDRHAQTISSASAVKRSNRWRHKWPQTCTRAVVQRKQTLLLYMHRMCWFAAEKFKQGSNQCLDCSHNDQLTHSCRLCAVKTDLGGCGGGGTHPTRQVPSQHKHVHPQQLHRGTPDVTASPVHAWELHKKHHIPVATRPMRDTAKCIPLQQTHAMANKDCVPSVGAARQAEADQKHTDVGL